MIILIHFDSGLYKFAFAYLKMFSMFVTIISYMTAMSTTKINFILSICLQTSKTWEMLGIDFVGRLTITPKGNSMILAITDLFSKWTEVYPLPDKQATSVAAALVNLFCSKVIPKAVSSDNGSEFYNNVMNLILITQFGTPPFLKEGGGVNFDYLPRRGRF